METWEGRERRGFGEPQDSAGDGARFSEVSWGPGTCRGMILLFCDLGWGHCVVQAIHSLLCDVGPREGLSL